MTNERHLNVVILPIINVFILLSGRLSEEQTGTISKGHHYYYITFQLADTCVQSDLQ